MYEITKKRLLSNTANNCRGKNDEEMGRFVIPWDARAGEQEDDEIESFLRKICNYPGRWPR